MTKNICGFLICVMLTCLSALGQGLPPNPASGGPIPQSTYTTLPTGTSGTSTGVQDATIVNATANGVVLDACRFGWTNNRTGLAAGTRDCATPNGNIGGTGNCSITSTLSTVTCASAPFIPGDTGKKAWVTINSAASSGCPIGTVTYVSATVITLSTTCTQTTGQAFGWIGTDNTAKLNALTLTLTANSHLYLGTGNMLVTDKILSNGILGAANALAVEVYGGGEATGTGGGAYSSLTNIVFPPYEFPYAGSLYLIGNGNLATYFHDFSIDNGISSSISTAGGGLLAFFYSNRVDRVAVSNWNMANYPCIYSALDQQQLTFLTSNGCAVGLKIASTNVTLIQPNLGTVGGANNYGLWNFDTSIVVVGGVIAKALDDVQGGHGTIAYYGTNFGVFGSGDSAITTVSGSTTYLFGALVAGGKDCVAFGNYTGLTNVAGGIVHASQTRFCSSGTGYSINNAGFFNDLGGNTYPIIGAGIYTGSGTVNGRSTLSGSAYTNATTTFSNVTGSSGQTFAFNVNASETLNVTCHIFWQGSAGTTGPKFQWTGPAAPTAVAAFMHSPVTTSTYLDASATAFSSSMPNTGTVTAATNFDAVLTLGVVNGTTAGAVTLQAAANGVGTLTIQPGSYCQSQ
jgi:hypothetical protein